jgi:hypothetical protein
VVQRSIVVLWSVLASACAVGVEENPFDVQADGAHGIPPAGADDEDDGESDADESTGDAPASSGDTTGSDDAALGTSGDDSSASEDDGGGPAATTEPPPEPTGDDAGPPPDGAQPGAGMYAPCLDAGACPGLGACFQTLDATTMMPSDGFCTIVGCADPALDCDPSPGGTAVPACYTTGGSSVCALDCSGGATCPTGMTCTTFVDGQLCV